MILGSFTPKYYPQCILKLAWFKGKDKTIFLDNRMVEGNIIQLQSEAMSFCFKHLNLSGVVRGLYREEELEVPADALREAIINALAHRLYTSSGSVSLAIYEDRVEISNPGNFNPEIAVQGAFPGMASTPRNPTIAKVLYLRKAIEMWGRGIGLIVNACEKARIAAPKIYEDHGFIYTVFTRPTVQEWKDKIGGGTTQATTQTTAQTTQTATQTTAQTGIHRSFELTDAQTRIVEYLREHPSASRREIVENSGVTISEDGVKYNLARLQDLHRIKRVGPDYGGHWEVCD